MASLDCERVLRCSFLVSIGILSSVSTPTEIQIAMEREKREREKFVFNICGAKPYRLTPLAERRRAVMGMMWREFLREKS